MRFDSLPFRCLCLGLTFGTLKELGACHYEQFPRYKDAIVSQSHDWLNERKTITLSINHNFCKILGFPIIHMTK
jgi:hypothetical protein